MQATDNPYLLPLFSMVGASAPPPHTPQIQQRILREAHAASALFHVNLLQEYLAAAADTDPKLIWDDINDERINVPGTVRPPIPEEVLAECVRSLGMFVWAVRKPMSRRGRWVFLLTLVSLKRFVV